MRKFKGLVKSILSVYDILHHLVLDVPLRTLSKLNVKAFCHQRGNSAAALDGQAEFVNALETHIKRPIDLSADIARYQSILSNASSYLNFALAPGLYLIPQDLALETDSTLEYNNELLQAPPSAFGTV